MPQVKITKLPVQRLPYPPRFEITPCCFKHLCVFAGGRVRRERNLRPTDTIPALYRNTAKFNFCDLQTVKFAGLARIACKKEFGGGVMVCRPAADAKRLFRGSKPLCYRLTRNMKHLINIYQYVCIFCSTFPVAFFSSTSVSVLFPFWGTHRLTLMSFFG